MHPLPGGVWYSTTMALNQELPNILLMNVWCATISK